MARRTHLVASVAQRHLFVSKLEGDNVARQFHNIADGGSGLGVIKLPGRLYLTKLPGNLTLNGAHDHANGDTAPGGHGALQHTLDYDAASTALCLAQPQPQRLIARAPHQLDFPLLHGHRRHVAQTVLAALGQLLMRARAKTTSNAHPRGSVHLQSPRVARVVRAWAVGPTPDVVRGLKPMWAPPHAA